MIEHGTIVEINNGSAIVDLQENESCKSCGICSGNSDKKRLTVELPLDRDYQPGQSIEIEISSAETLKGGLAVFILPLIAFMVGAFTGKSIFAALGIELDSDVASIIAGFALLVIVLAAVSIIYRSDSKSKKLTPHVRT
jgi:sigma-E factor negative regulatory protein RseC